MAKLVDVYQPDCYLREHQACQLSAPPDAPCLNHCRLHGDGMQVGTLNQQELVNKATLKPDDKGLLTQRAYVQRKRRELRNERSLAAAPPHEAGHALALNWGLPNS